MDRTERQARLRELVRQIHQDLADDLREHLTEEQILKVLPAIRRYADGLMDAAEMVVGPGKGVKS